MTESGNGWKETTLGEVIDIFDHRRVPLNSRQRAKRQGPYPYYGASGIIDWLDDYLFDGRYLLVAEDGENLNSRKLPVAFFASGKFWVNNHAHIIRGRPGIVDDYFLMSHFAASNISGFITGAAQPKLSQANLKRIGIRLPPFPIQRKIASILSAYDELIENNRRRIEVLEEMARRIYREWFVEFRFPGHENVNFVNSPMGKIPEGWNLTRLGDVSLNFDRKRKPLSKMERATRKGPYPYYGAAKIFDYIDDYIFDGDYLLVAEDGSVITRDRRPVLQLATGRFWANNHTHILQGRPPISTEFLYFSLCDQDVTGYVTGAAQPKITQANLNRFPVLVSDKRILEWFHRIARDFVRQIKLLEAKNDVLAKTRDLLLPRLISGELDVSDLPIDCGVEDADGT